MKSSILCIYLNVYVSAWHKLNNVYAYDVYVVKSPVNKSYLVIIFFKRRSGNMPCREEQLCMLEV